MDFDLPGKMRFEKIAVFIARDQKAPLENALDGTMDAFVLFRLQIPQKDFKIRLDVRRRGSVKLKPLRPAGIGFPATRDEKRQGEENCGESKGARHGLQYNNGRLFWLPTRTPLRRESSKSYFPCVNTLQLPLPDDFHVHLRQGALLESYAKTVAAEFGRILVMPNTTPPIDSAQKIEAYRAQIHSAAPGLEPLMTFKLNPRISASDLQQMKQAGAIAGKYYPAGVTTNSEDGISEFESIFPVISEMEKLNLVLCIHGEEPSAFCLDREPAFIRRVERLAAEFPNLRIVFEHLSTRAAVEAVLKMPQNVAATITAHHLLHTLDDVVGGALKPHHFCKPLPKRPEDREALRGAAFSGNPKFFFGSDSAPHAKSQKECCCGAAGVYTAPVAIPVLIQIFEEAGHMDKLPDFIGGFGADFYRIPRQTQKALYAKEPWTVPETVDGAVPLFAGQELSWKRIG